MSKICNKCNIEKCFDLYHKDKSKKDGYRNSCKFCQKSYSKKFYSFNEGKIREYGTNRYNELKYDDAFKERTKEIRKKGFTKKTKTVDILDCSIVEFRIYLESKFDSWMTWDNHGKYNGELNYGWDMDHIIPMASAKNEEEVIRLNHYTNFQPLDSYENRVIKRDKLVYG